MTTQEIFEQFSVEQEIIDMKQYADEKAHWAEYCQIENERQRQYTNLGLD